ncbi:hypothetical protein [Novosphingobium lindaniclasticum]|uniref:hypothetical protein n=1 Tax=Novosphingobium lindaniclasticum TaxID=1329895 RepID=UPI00190F1DDC|nr:hypothetical protein [Novosphingobium lindaniclasticum]
MGLAAQPPRIGVEIVYNKRDGVLWTAANENRAGLQPVQHPPLSTRSHETGNSAIRRIRIAEGDFGPRQHLQRVEISWFGFQRFHNAETRCFIILRGESCMRRIKRGWPAFAASRKQGEG